MNDDSETPKFLTVAAFARATGLPVSFIADQLVVRHSGKYVVPSFMLDEHMRQDAQIPVTEEQSIRDYQTDTKYLSELELPTHIAQSTKQTARISAYVDSHPRAETDRYSQFDAVNASADTTIDNILDIEDDSFATGLQDSQFDQIYKRIRASKNQLQAEPWTRFWARAFDLSVLSLLVLYGFHAIIVYSDALRIFWMNPLFLPILLFALVPVSILAETGIYAIFKTTFGKAILALRVLDRHDTELSAASYMKRNKSLYFSALAMMFIPATLPRLMNQYRLVTEGGYTSYDKRARITVEADLIGGFRVLLFVLCLVLSLVFWSEAYVNIIKPLAMNFLSVFR